MSKPPSRRAVMRAFGLYLDYAVWLARVKADLEEPLDGEGLSDMARSVLRCEGAYLDDMTAYIQSQSQE